MGRDHFDSRESLEMGLERLRGYLQTISCINEMVTKDGKTIPFGYWWILANPGRS